MNRFISDFSKRHGVPEAEVKRAIMEVLLDG